MLLYNLLDLFRFPNISVRTSKYGAVGKEDPSLVRGQIGYLGTLDR